MIYVIWSVYHQAWLRRGGGVTFALAQAAQFNALAPPTRTSDAAVAIPIAALGLAPRVPEGRPNEAGGTPPGEDPQ